MRDPQKKSYALVCRNDDIQLTNTLINMVNKIWLIHNLSGRVRFIVMIKAMLTYTLHLEIGA